jgi:transcriptional regulator GlxA family with amidase domain
MLRFGETSDEQRQMAAMASLNGFFAEIAMTGQRKSKSVDWVEKAKSALSSSLKSDMDLDEMAKSLGLKSEAFRKRFRTQTGVSPVRYRNGVRVEAAKQLISYSPHLTNAEIAEKLGFSDQFHFSKRFTQITGVSPSQFRQDKKG